ncbi:MAG: cytochrome c biogenesis protein CcsA [Pirellulales bacterium]
MTVIPDGRIRAAVNSNGIIDDSKLPFIVRIDKWMRNSRLDSGTDPDHKVSVGTGLVQKAVEIAPNGGAKSAPNFAAAYVTLLDRKTEKPIESLLLAQEQNDGAQMFRNGKDKYEQISLLGKPTEIALRYRKEYKPYNITLKDVARRDYANSNTPRDFSSVITIRNAETGEEVTEKTWMNNPVRFGGETFYQSDYFPMMLPNGNMVEGSGLQVVKNAGWVIPYVCCMMVMVGMISHFSGSFLRFANRFAKEQSANEKLFSQDFFMYGAAGLVIAGLFGIYGLKGSKYGVVEADWAAIGKLPAKQDGRVKPLDTVAGYTLQSLSEPVFGGVAYVLDVEENKRSQVEWLLGVMTDLPWTKDARVFRVYAKEVRELLDLDESRSNFRYSYNEITNNREAFFAEIDKLREKSRNQIEFNFREQKISDFYQKLTSYELISAAYDEPNLPKLDSGKEEDLQKALMRLDELDRRYKIIEDMKPLALIPPISNDKPVDAKQAENTWAAYGPARFDSILQKVRGIEPNPAIESFSKLLEAVRSQNAREINQAARMYKAQIAGSDEVSASQTKVNAEAWLNSFKPISLGVMLYIISTIAAVISFAAPKTRNAKHLAYGLIAGTFLIHTLTLLVRMYISGRAPVVNLYSSAVFIGWACVLFCLVLELVMRLGLANIVGSLIGLITLSIAGSLDKSDTMHVLAAVLDTQFWLSTHVVIITLGYAVTFLAGFLGAAAVLVMFIRKFKGEEIDVNKDYLLQQIYRMSYFSVCFGILFSFVGTVLGGLWADDSWGRFWGWDPKENGALMIVLWNALVLHARWDRMVGLLGFSILALVGNVVTSWSWFGTNLLGIGLHNYGFNKGIAYALLGTLAVHLVLISIGIVLSIIERSSQQQKVSTGG